LAGSLLSPDLRRALSIPDFRLHFFGGLAASFAMNMQVTARGWLVYQLTESELDLAWVTMSFMIPQVLFSLYGGVLADRYPKRRLIVIGQSLSAAATLVFTIIVLNESVVFWDFIWLGFFNGTVLALSMPARQAFVPELVPHALILSATSINTSGWNFARILGPAIAGLLIAVIADGDRTSFFGVGVVHLCICGLYTVSALSMRRVSVPGKVHPVREHVGREMLGSFQYIWNRPPLFGLIILSIIPFLFGMPLNTMLPAFNHDILGGGPDDLGYLISAMGLGAIIGSLYTAGLAGLPSKGFWVIATCIGWGAATFAFGFAHLLWLAFVAIFLVGLVSAANSALNRALLQMQVDPHMRGKVLSIDMMSHGLMPFGLMPISLIAEKYDVAVALAVSGGVFVLLVLICVATMKSLRVLDQGLR
jgi:MFS family permease